MFLLKRKEAKGIEKKIHIEDFHYFCLILNNIRMIKSGNFWSEEIELLLCELRKSYKVLLEKLEGKTIWIFQT
jgi:hypothetical protein